MYTRIAIPLLYIHSRHFDPLQELLTSHAENYHHAYTGGYGEAVVDVT